jgi:crotonobetainyl-CoA:carnitine CoA-transferase CaiB-like acyl-CoA transferase
MRTGEGLKVTTSLYANGLWCHATGVVGGQDRTEVGDGRVPMRTPTHFKEWGNPFYNIYKCKDGRWFYLLGGGYDKLHHTMKKMGLGEYVDDPRFKDHATMVKHCDVMYDMMEEAFLKKTSMEWKEIMEEINTSYEILWNNSDVTEDPQAWANGYLTRVTCPNGLEYVVPTTPVDFDGVEKPEAKHVGVPGCDTSEILAEYGYSAEEIGSLLAAGAALGK